MNSQQKSICGGSAAMNQSQTRAEPPAIPAFQAHEVAMVAAQAAGRIASPSTIDMDRLGEAIATAYLQAYKSVEGWSRPPANPFDLTKLMDKYGIDPDEILRQARKEGILDPSALGPRDAVWHFVKGEKVAEQSTALTSSTTEQSTGE